MAVVNSQFYCLHRESECSRGDFTKTTILLWDDQSRRVQPAAAADQHASPDTCWHSERRLQRHKKKFTATQLKPLGDRKPPPAKAADVANFLQPPSQGRLLHINDGANAPWKK